MPVQLLAFLIFWGGIVCICVGLCYVEFASMAPFAGSAYTYAYIALGEILAWVVGWDLLFEFTVVCSTVSVGWSGYVVSFLQSLGLDLPAAFARDVAHGGVVNIPAILGLLLVGYIAYSGVKNVSRANVLLTIIKLLAIFFFLACGLGHLQPANWHPFAPFGLGGILTGAALTFFAYTGFDGMTSVLEEVKNPQRSIPVALIGGLLIVIILYVSVAAVLTGVVNYSRLDVPDPAAFALLEMGIRWGGALLSVAVLFGLIAVMLGYGLSATRILFAMSRDGLLPPVLARVHPTTRVPYIATLLIFGVAILGGGFFSINELAELANIGGPFDSHRFS
ncbi:amino acid permease [Desulfothermobacter acidiphilus]|uniref:amino acid permease n=1 Tax=Desulfothermobacter acidiphilus TaxID=1938353 RepID=UPI003F892157